MATQSAFCSQQGIAQGSLSHHLFLDGVLLCYEIQLTISGSLESGCWSLEGVKVGVATAEGLILELEMVRGGLGTCVLSRSQKEEVCNMYHI